MPPKTTLNAKNLEALGAPRLAELLIELSTGNAVAKRRLRLELAGTASTGEVVREIRKRLSNIARSGTHVDWTKRRALVTDLDTQRRAIVELVAKDDPVQALKLIWQFLGRANSVFERCDDSSGTVIGVFDQAERIWTRSPRPRSRTQSGWPRTWPGRWSPTTTASTMI
jgi:hypothetical protein